MRSPLLMDRHDTGLLVVDLQERVLTAIEGRDRVVARCKLLVEAAGILGVPLLASEQYPRGLGTTTAELATLVGAPVEKLTFSACGQSDVVDRIDQWNVGSVLVCGIESHVCVLQSALDLAANGYRVYVAEDAVGSYRGDDKTWALARMRQAGVVVTTAETTVFEWTRSAEATEFKAISELIKRSRSN